MLVKPIVLQAIYQLVVSLALAALAYSVRTTDPGTFQMIVGALIAQTTAGGIHLGRQTSDYQKNGNGNGAH